MEDIGLRYDDKLWEIIDVNFKILIKNKKCKNFNMKNDFCVKDN